MAKAIINTTNSLRGNGLPQGLESERASLSHSFLVDFQEFSPYLHVFRAKDYTHGLLCEMTLEVKEIFVTREEGKEGGYLTPVAACSFPAISLQKLHEKTCFDGYLQDLLMGQFQLKILEQLLLFCEEKDATHLILTVNDAVHGAGLDYLKLYRFFLVSEEQVATSRGEETQIMIPADAETYDKVIDFMDKIDREFRCALWRGQSINPAFRDYLISNACM